MQRHHNAAAPPDAGGHFGAFTTPDDLLHTDREPGPRPPLHRVECRPAPPPRRLLGRAWVIGLVTAAVTALVVAVSSTTG